MLNKLVHGICPVISVNGETKELGWFYLPFIRNQRHATEAIDEAVTKLEKRNYSGLISKTTINTFGRDVHPVQPADSDFYLLAPIEYEAQVWIYFMDK